MVKLADITEIIPIPEDVTVTVEANNDVTVKGKKYITSSLSTTCLYSKLLIKKNQILI